MNRNKFLKNKNFLDKDLTIEEDNLNITNLKKENIKLRDEINYFKSLNENLEENNEISLNNLLKSKELNELKQKKLNTKIQLNKDNFLRIKKKLNLKKKTNNKYHKDMENNSNELFINQLLDLYNLKKLNEIL